MTHASLTTAMVTASTIVARIFERRPHNKMGAIAMPQQRTAVCAVYINVRMEGGVR